MPLGKNRRYNTVNGLPSDSARLGVAAANRTRGTIVTWGAEALPAFVENRPKTGAGLPTGDDAEQWIVDFQGVFEVDVHAVAGDAVTAGEDLNGVITAVGGSYSGTAQVGDLVNDTSETGLTITSFHTNRKPYVWDVVDGTSVAAGARGRCYVIIGV